MPILPPAPPPGHRFGRWTVTGDYVREKRGATSSRFLLPCRCDCGAERLVPHTSLRKGTSRSCGCLIRDVQRALQTKHNDCIVQDVWTPEYSSWVNMKQRCTNPKAPNWPAYGGRGIKVCERWRNSYVDFLTDMGRKADPKFQIDRIDPNGNYEPGNCRWVSASANSNNKRDTRRISFNGETKTLAEWAQDRRLLSNTIYRRLRDGWSIAEALGFEPRRRLERNE